MSRRDRSCPQAPHFLILPDRSIRLCSFPPERINPHYCNKFRHDIIPEQKRLPDNTFRPDKYCRRECDYRILPSKNNQLSSLLPGQIDRRDCNKSRGDKGCKIHHVFPACWAGTFLVKKKMFSRFVSTTPYTKSLYYEVYIIRAGPNTKTHS